MPPESVSFRISRTAEDLAQTVAALSRRLVALEQSIEAIELQLQSQRDLHPQEVATLDRVDRLLSDCRGLLEPADAPPPAEGPAGSEPHHSDQLAA